MSVEIGWLESGKPVVKGHDGVEVSLAHDDRLALCVAGAGPQGCDIAPVTTRSREDWVRLLGSTRTELLDRLAEADGALDRAGTRIWAAVEALRKTGAQGTPELTFERRRDDSVLFRGPSGLTVLTFPVALTRGPERIVAVIVEPADRPEPVADSFADEAERLAAEYGYRLDSFSMPLRRDPGSGQLVFVLRFPVTFRETANLSRTLYFTHYFIWLGKMRELGVQPVYAELADDFETGRWGMVTNTAETRILGEVRADDVIEARVTVESLGGPANSTHELHFDWRRVVGDETVRVAWSKMVTTWVEILDHGLVEPRPLPEYYGRMIEQMTEKSGRLSDPLPATVDETDLGPALLEVPPGPINPALLHEHAHETSLEDANLVGNVYFANYYIFQGRTRDAFVYALSPDLFRGTGEQGELRCLHCKIEHLREAMPFQAIVTRMSLESLHERGVRLRFDYFRQNEDGSRDKLGSGTQTAGWYAPGADGEWRPSALPAVVRDGIRRIAEAALLRT